MDEGEEDMSNIFGGHYVVGAPPAAFAAPAGAAQIHAVQVPGAAPGAAPPAAMVRAMMQAGGVGPAGSSWQAGTSGQGVSTPAEEMDPLPFDELLNGGIFDATHQNLEFESFPQRPFRGERLIGGAFSSTLSDPVNNVVISPAGYVGAVQIGSTQGRMPLSAFINQAFGVRLSFPSAGQGTRIFFPLQTLVAVAGMDTIGVSITVIGRTVR